VGADANELQNAVLNLALNSRDAMPDGGDITIATRNVPRADGVIADAGLGPGEYLEIAVSDTGAGMTADVVARAFDPFFTTKPVGSGTGLGLSQVYRFARQCGGTVTIESAPGAGTTVRLFLPRAQPVDSEAPAPTAGAPFAPIPQPI
jgi:signal transduction histidine kinase